MQLRMLREHYRTVKNNKGEWVPKRSFNSKREANKAGFHNSLWKIYKCKMCDKFHVADLRKGQVVTNDR